MFLSDEYLTISSKSESITKEKGSKFLGFAFPINSEEEAKTIIEDLKKEYYTATHHCYAYALGLDQEQYRINDDGEPSGTAGKPIFGQIRSFNLTDILVVSVRYFGGTKLGVSGLIKAYKASAKETLQNAEIIKKILKVSYILEFDYNLMNDVMKIIKENNIDIIKNISGTECVLQLEFRKGLKEVMIDKFSSLKHLNIKPL